TAGVLSGGVLGDIAVVGGPKSATFRYDAAARSWSRVPVEEVTQVAPALGRLWLLGKGSKVYAIDAADHTPPGKTASALFGGAGPLVALAADGSAHALTGPDQKWREVRAAPAGPGPELLRDPTLSVAAAGDDLFLA